MRDDSLSGFPSASRPTHAAWKMRRLRWYWLLIAGGVLAGVLLACEGWAAWQEQLAAQALADDHLDQAKRHIGRALWLRRHRTSTRLLAARIRRLSGAYTEAEQHLLDCGRTDGMSAPVQLEWLLLRCQQGELDELAPNLLALVRQGHPDSAAILETLASVYIRHMRYLEAVGCLERWLEFVPGSVRALDWHGWVAQQLDRREHAANDYERLLDLQPGRTDIRLRLAQVLIDSSRHAEAVVQLERLLVEMPDNADVLTALSRCRVVQTRTDAARDLLDLVLKDHPDHVDALLQRGKLELTLGRPAAAEPWLRQAVQIKPHDPEARYSLYRSLQGQPQRQTEAESEWVRWKQTSQKLARLTRLLRTDLAAHPHDVNLAREAGELLLQVGEEQRGLFWLARALAVNPQHIPSHRVLLDYYERTGHATKAAEQRRQLAALADKKEEMRTIRKDRAKNRGKED